MKQDHSEIKQEANFTKKMFEKSEYIGKCFESQEYDQSSLKIFITPIKQKNTQSSILQHQSDQFSPFYKSMTEQGSHNISLMLQNNGELQNGIKTNKTNKVDNALFDILVPMLKVNKLPKENLYKQLIREIGEQYQYIIQGINSSQNISHFLPAFFPTSELQQDNYISKILLFEPNIKNGRTIRYSNAQKSCIPFFKCFGCQRQFLRAQALGGHVGQCSKKNIHKLNIEVMTIETKIVKQLQSRLNFIFDEQMEQFRNFSETQRKKVVNQIIRMRQHQLKKDQASKVKIVNFKEEIHSKLISPYSKLTKRQTNRITMKLKKQLQLFIGRKQIHR